MPWRSDGRLPRSICALGEFDGQLRIDNPTVAGFLIDDDVLLTAEHGIRTQEDCASSHWVFDYAVGAPGGKAGGDFPVDRSNVYGCAKILMRGSDECGTGEFVLVKLDREVADRTPLAMRTSGEVADGARLAHIGFPNGLPLKVALVEIIENTDRFAFLTSFTLSGFSGGPLVDVDTGIVEGIGSCVQNSFTAKSEHGGMLYDGEDACYRYVQDGERPPAGSGIVSRSMPLPMYGHYYKPPRTTPVEPPRETPLPENPPF